MRRLEQRMQQKQLKQGPAGTRMFGWAGRFSFLFFLAAWGMAGGGEAAAQEYSILQSFFLPPQYYVGDRVELRLRVVPEEELVLEGPGSLPKDDTVEYHDVSVKDMGREYQVLITFSSYAPGRQELPPLSLGDITLEGLRINTASLAEEGYSELQEPRPQAVIPSSRLILTLAAGLLLAVPLGGFFLYRILRDQGRRVLVWYQENRPRRQMIRHLRNLKGRVLELDRRDFYSQFSVGLRKYLSLRLGRDCNSATTRELVQILRAALPPHLAERFFSLFEVADLVKFGSRYSSVEEQVDHLRECLEAVLELEGKEGRHVDL